MKKTVLAALAVLPASLFAQENFSIKGKAGDLNSPAKAYLNYRTSGGVILDSAEVVNGSFQFQGSVATPMKATVALYHKGEDLRQNRNPDRIEVYLENGNSEVTTADSLVNAKISGSPANQALQKHRDLSQGPTAKMAALQARFMAASEAERNNNAFRATLQEESRAIAAEQKVIDLNFIESHSNSLVSLDLLTKYVDSEPLAEVIEPAFKRLSVSLQNSPAGEALTKRIAALKNVEIGAIAPEFAQPDTAGNMVALSSLRGQYVLIDFWASWCGPCRQENPNVVAAFHKFKDQNFTILGVSLDQPGRKDAWMKAIHDDGLQHWTNISELKFWDSDVVAQYAIRGIPQNFLLDPEGRIIAKNLRGKALHDKLAEVLN